MLHYLLAFQDHAEDAATHVEHLEPMQGSALTAITALVVFGAVLLILWKTVWPKITEGLDDRERKIRETLAQADAAKASAEAALAEYQENLAQGRVEAGEMIAKAKADAKAVGEELKKRNEADLSEMTMRATREIDSAKKAAIIELHAEASVLAVAVASKILQREISAADQQKFVDEALNELGNVKNS